MAGSPSLGAGVKFDAVVFLRRDGTARVTTFVGAACTGVEIRAGTAAIAGNTICGWISGALLGSTGFVKSDYTWNLWPRIGATNDTIWDFAPNSSNVAVSVVPEPFAYALMGLGLGLVGLLRWRGATA